jgi:hypothetical protein
VRNLKIKWAVSQLQKQTFQQSTSGGGMLGIGPFFCGGSGSSNDSDSNFQNTFNSEGIEVQGVQLIGYISVINPASPRLDSKDFMVKATDDPNKGTTTSTTSTSTTTTPTPSPALAHS